LGKRLEAMRTDKFRLIGTESHERNTSDLQKPIVQQRACMHDVFGLISGFPNTSDPVDPTALARGGCTFGRCACSSPTRHAIPKEVRLVLAWYGAVSVLIWSSLSLEARHVCVGRRGRGAKYRCHSSPIYTLVSVVVLLTLVEPQTSFSCFVVHFAGRTDPLKLHLQSSTPHPSSAYICGRNSPNCLVHPPNDGPQRTADRFRTTLPHPLDPRLPPRRRLLGAHHTLHAPRCALLHTAHARCALGPA